MDIEDTNAGIGDTDAKVNAKLKRIEANNEDNIQEYLESHPKQDISGLLKTSELLVYEGGSQPNSRAFPNPERGIHHGTAKATTIGTFARLLLLETAARVKIYATQRATEIIRQHFTEYLLLYTQPNTTTATGESSPNGVPALSIEPSVSTPRQSTGSGQKQLVCNKGKAQNRRESGNGDDDSGEDEGNGMKRPRIRKPSSEIPFIRYACIYFADAMKFNSNS
ncbi:uncharacterized protein DFL_001429 [Arthrobotrys flagrans]|uniref:Uncharacterized protein n=1 Tax=Arthrobotrys flagrans TaxID=97331 RepID=A0A437A7W1_ARTFL|nr:hypothetical protein DFL_001429 [Arthrobotrys flagrans]